MTEKFCSIVSQPKFPQLEMLKLVQIILAEDWLDPEKSRVSNYFVNDGHTHQIRSYPMIKNGQIVSFKLHYLDNEVGACEGNFATKFEFNAKTKLSRLISATPGLMISLDKQGFDLIDIELMEASIELIKLINGLKTETEFEILKYSEKRSFQFERLAKTIFNLIGKEEFKKALTDSETFEDGQDELDEISDSGYKRITFEGDTLEIVQKILKPYWLKKLNYYKPEKYQSQRILNQVLLLIQYDLREVAQGTTIKNPSQKQIQDILQELKKLNRVDLFKLFYLSCLSDQFFIARACSQLTTQPVLTTDR